MNQVFNQFFFKISVSNLCFVMFLKMFIFVSNFLYSLNSFIKTFYFDFIVNLLLLLKLSNRKNKN